MDVISLHQAGFPNTIATLGTAITPEQARLIAQYAKEVVISYDSDGAGQAATERALNHFTAVGLPCRILKMEGAKDPDEYIKKFGADRFRMLIENAGDVIRFELDRCKKDLETDTEMGKSEYIRRTVPVLGGIENDIQREVYIKSVSREMDISADLLRRQIEEAMRKKQYGSKRRTFRAIESQSLQHDEINPQADTYRKESRAEEMILAYLLHRPEEYEMLWSLIPPERFKTDFHRKVYAAICEICQETGSFSLSMLHEHLDMKEFSRITGIFAKYQDLPLSRDAVTECAKVLQDAAGQIVPSAAMTDDDLLLFVNSKKKQA